MSGKRPYTGGARSGLPPAKAGRQEYDEAQAEAYEDGDEGMDVDETEAAFMEAEVEERAALGAASLADYASRMKMWARHPVPASEASGNACGITFQQLDVDYVIANPEKAMFDREVLPGEKVALLRIFGVDAAGHSVCALVHGFEPYFYTQCPPSFGPDDCVAFKAMLNERMAVESSSKGAPVYVTKVAIERKQTLWGYQAADSQPFLKIVMASPTMVASCRTIFERGVRLPGISGERVLTTYESTVLFVMRFMVDMNISGANWLEAPPGSYSRRTGSKKVSNCQIEIDIKYNRLISHESVGEYAKIAPFRILSVDIECAGRKGHFPEAESDPVIQIASHITVHGESEPRLKNVMTLKGCSAISGAEVISFDRETDLLMAWRDFLRGVDPDIIIGYNIVNFDIPYLLDRAKALRLTAFPLWGRIEGSMCRMRDTVFSSKAYGTRESKETTIEGRIQLDLLQAIQRDHKLSSYTLNAVSAHFLGEQKEDVHHSCITDLQNGNDDTRRRLAVYCLKDAYLPQRLFDSLKYMFNYVEMARVTGVPVSFLLTRGQSIKVFSQILRKARSKNLIVPTMKSQKTSDEVAFEGATVLDAKQGYYDKPIATLDFASLYPSIMMAHNLCYCTLLSASVAKSLPPDQVTKSPMGCYFAKPSLKKGILPEILEELISARKRAKKDLKEATDPLEEAVLNGRQLALKVSANSVYGFTGATVGKLPCLEISSTVTAFGREMIEQTRNEVMKRYTVENGYKHDATVIYGDTDSVMVKFGVDTVDEAMQLGEEAAEFISKTFIKPIKLEFEKVYFPYLLINKKRYAGMYWTNPEKPDKLDAKGIETVRRDNCELVRELLDTSLNKILRDRDVAGAIQYVKNVISDLLMNKIDLSLLVITKALSRDADKYDNKQAHVELAKRMKERDPATAPTLGDRVPYVIIKAMKGAKAYEKAEDPIYALENNIPIDFQHYLDHQIQGPLLRIFEPIMKNPQQLLSGDHTRHVSNPTPTTGGLMRFVKVQKTCLGCKVPINSGALCKNCENNTVDLYWKQLQNVNSIEYHFSRLWTQCQRCQGSLHQDVLCTNNDCPIFYRRKKVQKDLKDAHATLERYAW